MFEGPVSCLADHGIKDGIAPATESRRGFCSRHNLNRAERPPRLALRGVTNMPLTRAAPPRQTSCPTGPEPAGGARGRHRLLRLHISWIHPCRRRLLHAPTVWSLRKGKIGHRCRMARAVRVRAYGLAVRLHETSNAGEAAPVCGSRTRSGKGNPDPANRRQRLGVIAIRYDPQLPRRHPPRGNAFGSNAEWASASARPIRALRCIRRCPDTKCKRRPWRAIRAAKICTLIKPLG